MSTSSKSEKIYDLVCVGGGIMSSTLALLVKLLDPDVKITVFERLNKVGMESSGAWNNAGTGHSAFCELNYTPEMEDGSIDISKAISTFSQFERSKQFWTYLINEGLIKKPENFIKSCPHHSWVKGEKDVAFLKKRYEAMQQAFMFKDMKFTDNPEVMSQWFPLIMKNRDASEPTAATRMEMGAEVNYGSLTEKYFSILKEDFDQPVEVNTEVEDIYQSDSDQLWNIATKNKVTGGKKTVKSKRVFIGAGGDALLLLQKTGIKEKDGYGGFPVSGQFLFCKNEEIINQHWAKVYSKAGPDAPPMSTPHLDTRYINGKRELLFGPFAGFTPKFLKTGSNLDLFKSIKTQNIKPLLGAFWHNLDLSKYLLGQLTMSHKDRIEELKDFIHDAKGEDWELITAGQRVQIIKQDNEEWGKLQFGTEVVHNEEGSVTALLGASPGASTAVHIMLEVLRKSFPKEIAEDKWKDKLYEMIPFWDKDVDADEKAFREIEQKCFEALKFDQTH